MALQIKIVRNAQAGAFQRAEQPAHQALLQMFADIADEGVKTGFDAGDQVAQETDGIVDNRSDNGRGLGQNAQQHVLEGDDLLGYADRCVVNAIPQAFVLFAQPFLERGYALLGFCVLLGERIHEAVAAFVDLADHRIEVAGDCGSRLFTEAGDTALK